MKLDLLAFGAHPDDVEISAGGTIAKMVSEGKKIGIIDLTRGELGSRGSAELRDQESARASEILGVVVRDNLRMSDGFFSHDDASLKLIIQAIRKYQPEIVIANSITDRHPDHGKGAKLVAEACFLSGLRKIQTQHEGHAQMAYRPRALYHYIQDYHIEPDFVVDISGFMDVKIESIQSYSSQLFDPESKEPDTPISGKEFFDFIPARAMNYGRPIGAIYRECSTKTSYFGLASLFTLI